MWSRKIESGMSSQESNIFSDDKCGCNNKIANTLEEDDLTNKFQLISLNEKAFDDKLTRSC